MSTPDYYDLQDYPATPVADDFLVEVARAFADRRAGAITSVEVAAIIIDHVLTLEPDVRAAIDREHDAMAAYYDRQGREADYQRLQAALQRSTATTRLLLERLRAARD